MENLEWYGWLEIKAADNPYTSYNDAYERGKAEKDIGNYFQKCIFNELNFVLCHHEKEQGISQNQGSDSGREYMCFRYRESFFEECRNKDYNGKY
ncbi:MAG: hypothetical protein FVQ80_14440 [Planctomycetes bacterium]|nr:hypothetical protein [Planctomycetota bacterium]